jgi:hypothetical protein
LGKLYSGLLHSINQSCQTNIKYIICIGERNGDISHTDKSVRDRILHTFDVKFGLGLVLLVLGFLARGSLFLTDLGVIVDVSRNLFMTYH